jgi:hypothetical protein
VVDVIFASDNVTVLGGPSRLELDLNVGASGSRGSLFFIGTQNPNSLNPSQDFPEIPLIFDVFINANSSSDDYLQAYQYVSQEGDNIWVPSFSLNRNVFSLNKVLDFELGEAEIDINLFELGLTSLPFDNTLNSFAYFNVQATLSGVNLSDLEEDLPVAFSVNVGDAYFDNSENEFPSEFPWFLPVSFRAVEFDGSTWLDVNEKSMQVNLTVSFANPNEIFEVVSQNGVGES